MWSLEQIKNMLEARNLSRGIASLSDLPHPHSFKDMDKAVAFLASAIARGQKILLVGDYDVDGVSATAIVCDFFSQLNYAHFYHAIPNRFAHGYGLSVAVVEAARAAHGVDFDLILTADNGITAFDAAEYCKAQNITLVITDHHEPKGELPCANAVVDPKRADCTFLMPEICGSVVVWYFLAALRKVLAESEVFPSATTRAASAIDMKKYFPFLALATIADIMPLVGINRLFVRRGLEALKTAATPFAYNIRERLKGDINAESVGFSITPLLNCAGRMGCADLSLAFMLATDPKESFSRFNELVALNNERKKVQSDVLEQAMKAVVHGRHCVLAYGENWHDGVLGIVCANLAERFNKCAFVLSAESVGAGESSVEKSALESALESAPDSADLLLKGSGRSMNGVNLIATISAMPYEILEGEFGGHASAMGLRLKKSKVADFIAAFDASVVVDAPKAATAPLEIDFSIIGQDLLNLLESYEPFGAENPKPEFLTRGVRIISVSLMGAQKNHAMLTLEDARGRKINAVKFNTDSDDLSLNRTCSVVYNVYFDMYSRSLKIRINDFVE